MGLTLQAIAPRRSKYSRATKCYAPRPCAGPSNNRPVSQLAACPIEKSSMHFDYNAFRKNRMYLLQRNRAARYLEPLYFRLRHSTLSMVFQSGSQLPFVPSRWPHAVHRGLAPSPRFIASHFFILAHRSCRCFSDASSLLVVPPTCPFAPFGSCWGDRSMSGVRSTGAPVRQRNPCSIDPRPMLS